MHLSLRTAPALIGACVSLLLLCSPALAGPTVTVRVEGETTTLLPATTVTLGAPEPVSGCAGNSVAAAINLAVGGNWDHGEANHGGGDFTQTILGETHAFTNEADTWAEWVDYKWGGGVCTDLLNEGDEVVMIADHEPEPTFAPTVLPLTVAGVPTTVQAGMPFTVTVSAVHTPAGTFAEPGQGTPEPAAGVTVSADGVSATTAADGTATLTPSNVGIATLRATKAGDAPSRTVPLCVHNGNDGTCGTSAPGAAPGAGAVAGASATKPYTGPFALVASVRHVGEGQVYSPRQAPRLIEGTLLGHSPVASVELRLRRSFHGRCYAFDGQRARFRRVACGSGSFFKVSRTAAFSYLLPSALARGRYVLDIQGTDTAGNRTTLARGSTRLVFYVG